MVFMEDTLLLRYVAGTRRRCVARACAINNSSIILNAIGVHRLPPLSYGVITTAYSAGVQLNI